MGKGYKRLRSEDKGFYQETKIWNAGPSERELIDTYEEHKRFKWIFKEKVNKEIIKKC